MLIEGINTTEGTSGAGFYFDYASLEEAFLGTSRPVGGDAEPRRAEPVHRALGRQPASRASITSTGTTTRCRARTCRTSTSRRPRSTTAPIRVHSNEIDQLLRPRHQRRRPDQEGQDRGTSAPTASRRTRSRSRTSTFDKTFDTKLWNPSARRTYQMNQNNKLIGYYQWGQKEQPNRLPFGDQHLRLASRPTTQLSGSWVYKGEWNGTVSDKLYVEARYGDFGYYFPLITNSQRSSSSGTTTARSYSKARTRRSSSIATASSATGAVTYFHDTGKGSHTFKFGGELLLETVWEGYLQRVRRHHPHRATSTATACRPGDHRRRRRLPGRLARRANDCLTSQAALNPIDAFVTDTWTIGRTDAEPRRPLGPLRRLHAGSGSARATRLARAVWRRRRRRSRRRDHFTWNVVVPRIGVDLRPARQRQDGAEGATTASTGSTPASTLAPNANPNQASKTVTYSWLDSNVRWLHPGDKRWQPGEEGACGQRGARRHGQRRSEHRAAVLARGERVDRAADHREDGRARRVRLHDRRRPDRRSSSRAVRPRRLHGAVHRHRRRRRRRRRHGRRSQRGRSRHPERATPRSFPTDSSSPTNVRRSSAATRRSRSSMNKR